jgi:hypothetical protein
MGKEKIFKFNKNKNKKLLKERGIGFKQIINILKIKRELDVIDHLNKIKYPRQKIFVVKIKKFIYAVPYLKEKDSFFLKTIFPSRKLTKKYLLKTKK